MFRFALCDDDKDFIEKAKMYIYEGLKNDFSFDEEIECICYSSGEELIKDYLSAEIDIVFMDIECGSMNGFDIAKELYSRNKNIGIVYMTDYSHYISKAFVCRPLGFINKANFQNELAFPIMNIVEFLQERGNEIIFSDRDNILRTKISDVKVVEVFDHKLAVQTVDKYIEVRSKLAQYEEVLLKNDFVKISRSILLNLKYLEKVKGQYAIVTGEKQYKVSRERKKDILNRIKVYQGEKVKCL